ncbi:MAG: DUF4390 domain-containing protein [Quisquiliibacterium sp.]
MTFRRIQALLLALLVWTTGLGLARPAWAAEGISVDSAQLQRAPESAGWVVSADFRIELSDQQRDAINRGVALPFTFEFELLRPRWYWWDERAVQEQRVYRLSYHALTRQYRLADDDAIRPYSTLQQALGELSRLRGWRVMDIRRPQPGILYKARIRLRLDVSLLAKPFQISSLTSDDWTLQSEWKTVRFNP